MSENAIRFRGLHYATGEPIQVTLAGDRIHSVEPVLPKSDVTNWPYVSPAFFDLQINGHGGTWFSDDRVRADAVLKALLPHYRFGVTRLCPTLITNSFDGLANGFNAIRTACEQAVWADQMVCGCHLEGPYISPEDGPRGAHPRKHVRPADWDEFQRLQAISGDRIRLVTLAPEIDNAIPFIRQAVSSGVVVAIGHTAATPDQIRVGVDAGATLSTHLGNGCHTMIHRHRNVIFEQLADPRLTASLIVDRHHLPESLVRICLQVKTPQKIILTSDAAGWAGCPTGVYENPLGRSEILPSGKLVVAGQNELLAGSTQSTDQCVANVIAITGVSLKDAVEMASKNPAQLLGQEVCQLQSGSLADLILFHFSGDHHRLEIEATIAAGELKFGELADR